MRQIYDPLHCKKSKYYRKYKAMEVIRIEVGVVGLETVKKVFLQLLLLVRVKFDDVKI